MYLVICKCKSYIEHICILAVGYPALAWYNPGTVFHHQSLLHSLLLCSFVASKLPPLSPLDSSNLSGWRYKKRLLFSLNYPQIDLSGACVIIWVLGGVVRGENDELLQGVGEGEDVASIAADGVVENGASVG